MFEIITHKRSGEVKKESRRMSIDSIIIHHTWSGSIDSCINHWKKTGYGTHFIIDRKGVVNGISPCSMKVNHCVGWNDRAIGIDLLRAPNEEILDCQYQTLNELVVFLVNTYRMAPPILHKQTLYFHCDLRPTQCPRPIEDSKIIGYVDIPTDMRG